MKQFLKVGLQERDELTPACPCNEQAVSASTPRHPSPPFPCAYENQCALPFSPRTHKTLFLRVAFNLLAHCTLIFIFSENWLVVERTIFWDITPCRPSNVDRRFGRTYRPELYLPPVFTLDSCRLILRRWRWRHMFFRNVGWHSTDYTVLYFRR
jgi:hypothetical protein